MPAPEYTDEPEEVIESKEACGRAVASAVDRTSAAYQPEYCENKQMAAKLREEYAQALHEVMGQTSLTPIIWLEGKPFQEAQGQRQPCHPGRRTPKIRYLEKSFSLTAHFAVQEDTDGRGR